MQWHLKTFKERMEERNLFLRLVKPVTVITDMSFLIVTSVACEQARRLGETKRNWFRREGKTAEPVGTLLKSQFRPFWTNLLLNLSRLIISSTWIHVWMHWNVNRSHVKITARAKIRAFILLLWTKWNGGKKRWRAYTTPTFVTYVHLPFFYGRSSDLFCF